jgi:hypothetical protein
MAVEEEDDSSPLANPFAESVSDGADGSASGAIVNPFDDDFGGGGGGGGGGAPSTDGRVANPFAPPLLPRVSAKAKIATPAFRLKKPVASPTADRKGSDLDLDPSLPSPSSANLPRLVPVLRLHSPPPARRCTCT